MKGKCRHKFRHRLKMAGLIALASALPVVVSERGMESLRPQVYRLAAPSESSNLSIFGNNFAKPLEQDAYSYVKSLYDSGRFSSEFQLSYGEASADSYKK